MGRVLAARERTGSWRVAMVVPLQGPAGLFGPSCEAISELAVHEVNAAGGILGREVQLEIVDGGAPPGKVADELRRLLDLGRVDAVTGWHISSVRNALAPVLAGRVPYVYTSLYEGGERRSGIYCCGEVPRFQIRPALRWLRDQLGVRRWFIVGNDYVWPRGTSVAVHRYAHELGLDIVGETFVQLGSPTANQLAMHAALSGCDGVFMLLVGQDAVYFNQRFAEYGLHEGIVRFSPLMEENMLLASGDSATRNLFASAAYFRSLVTADAADLRSRYMQLHGPTAPPLSNMAESCYEGMHTLATLVSRAGTTELAGLNAAIDGVAYHGPRGTIEFQGQQAAQHVYLAAANGYDFDVITRL
ncbi:substrate-binding domain-containing protein [Pendulispora albinea]|uniref:Substrate-binding domain-containing protein n=1 Tax=Pendulispora albinea TaxID=2741071 RepID=A0ABZ2M1S6_9BACT